MKNIGILTLLFVVFFSACRKDVNLMDVKETKDETIIEQFDPPSEMINGDVIGLVVDEDNKPLEGATVTLNNLQLTTNTVGHFIINNADMDKFGTLVRVEKNGFFNGSRRFFPVANVKNRIKIQLLRKDFIDSFNSADGGTIEFGNGAFVEFKPNSIKASDGQPYNGWVRVVAKWLDPSLPETGVQMPGNLIGVNSQVEQVALSTYGMIAVELQSTPGNEILNIRDGETAKISMPIPSSMLSSAPSEIPLWSYNEEKGYWVEESIATNQNGNYVGEVSHFSFWNCDIPSNYVFLDMTLVDGSNNNNPLSNYFVKIEVADGMTGNGITTSGTGYSDDDGNVAGYVPSGEELILKILDECGEAIFTQTLGPLNMDTSLGDISINNINSTTIFGNLLDCDNEPITNGYLKVKFDGQAKYFYTPTSNFSFTFSTCAATNDIEVIGINIDALDQSNSISATPLITNDLGNVIACGNLIDNTLTITVDGVTEVYHLVAADPWGTTTFIHSIIYDPFDIGFGFKGQTTGDYGFNNYMDGIRDSNHDWDLRIPDTSGLEFFEVTQYDTKLVGSFSGEVENKIGWIIVPFSGEFNIEL